MGVYVQYMGEKLDIENMAKKRSWSNFKSIEVTLNPLKTKGCEKKGCDFGGTIKEATVWSD